ncbi:hypothetical protein MRS76_18660 [Rhizobiaceae bacterium n13]|uniref:Uncharacterized protein n=1 Tax=Ferirhizobium litorale TaxID=2927786 RepID=A0AAE3QK27_9HYPH|nr:hypothetical protein [Fererhizobium litorale]MDI7863973.1 hypothetical protein [Fererhizobium litorale]MDI7924543.1 hypothetical protein [Fererhizobium litorale]
MNTKPETTVTIEKRQNGRWCFVLKFRGVTYPAQGQFASLVQAQAEGQAALKALVERS